MIEMKGSEKELKLMAIAIFSVLSMGAGGDALQSSHSRSPGKKWSLDHRKRAMGMESLSVTRSKRSSKR
mgnify:FL=1